MADLGTFRPFITVVTFLGLLVVLIDLIPSELYSAEDMRKVMTPDQFEATNLPMMNYTQIKKYTLNWSEVKTDNFDIGHRALQLKYNSWVSPFYVQIFHRFGLFLWGSAQMDWYREGIKVHDNEIYADELNADYDDGGLDALSYTLIEGEVHVDAAFSFDTNIYDSPFEAWQDDALKLWLGIEWNYVGTAYNAWDLIGMLLFFRLPNIHPVVNMILAIPIWSAVAILTVTVVTSIIPFIRGL